MFRIIPLEDRVVLKVAKVEEKTPGGILLPDAYKERHEMAQLEAEVIELGEFAFVDSDVKPEVGDTVLITKYAGKLYTLNDEEYRLVTPRDILGIKEQIDDRASS